MNGSSATAFFAWANQYRNSHMVPHGAFANEVQQRLHQMQLWERLRPILKDLAADLERAGIDASACRQLRGVLDVIHLHNPEPMLERVWYLADHLRDVESKQPPPAVRSVDDWLNETDPLKRGSVSRKAIEEAFEQHCHAMGNRQHCEKAKEWKRLHPLDPRTPAQLQKASAKYPYTTPSKPK